MAAASGAAPTSPPSASETPDAAAAAVCEHSVGGKDTKSKTKNNNCEFKKF